MANPKPQLSIRGIFVFTAIAAMVLAIGGPHVAIFLGAVVATVNSTRALFRHSRREGIRVFLAFICVGSWLILYALSIGPCSLIWTYMPKSIRDEHGLDFHLAVYKPLFAMHKHGILEQPFEWYTRAWMFGREI